MAGLPEIVPVTVEEVFDDYKGRRFGLIKALALDVEEFYKACDPEKENLYLYALPDGPWEVSVPVEEVPTELPEPALGINFSRDGMQTNDWLSLVAIHSDSWLMAVAFFLCGYSGFRSEERKQLFELINKLPTVFEVWRGLANRRRDHPGKDNNNTKTDSGSKVQAVDPPPPKVPRLTVPKDQNTGNAEDPQPTRVATLALPEEKEAAGDAEQSSGPCCGLKKLMAKVFN